MPIPSGRNSTKTGEKSQNRGTADGILFSAAHDGQPWDSVDLQDLTIEQCDCFSLDIFSFSLIIRLYLKNTKEQDDVGNNSAKEQPQTETRAGLQKAHEHSQRQGSHQPP
jgi:hypothetical protein